MAKYHLKPDGTPGKCTATKKDCPLGEDAIHGATPEELYKAFEEKMKESLVPTPAQKIITPVLTSIDPLKDPYEGNTIARGWVHWDADYESRCSKEMRGDTCDDYMCHHGTVGSIRNATSKEQLLENVAKEIGIKEIPETVLRELDLQNIERNFVAEVWQGYYGEEVDVRLKRSVQEAIDKAFYNRPNVSSQQGELEWARANGVDTTGKNEIEALQALTGGKLNKQIQGEIAKANVSFKENLVMSKIKFSPTAYKSATQAPIPLNNQKNNNAGGVVIPNNDGTYTLVSADYSRFKTVQEAGRKTWNFYVLKHKTEKPRWGVEKQALDPQTIDLTDW